MDHDEKNSAVDPLYIEILGSIVVYGWVSVPLIQHKCRVGYNRACRIMEWLEEMGYVSANGEETRDVLLTKEEYKKIYGPLPDVETVPERPHSVAVIDDDADSLEFDSLSDFFEDREKKSNESPRLWDIDYESVTEIEVSYGSALAGGLYLHIDCVAGKVYVGNKELQKKFDIKNFTRKLCDIVSIWEKKMVDHYILDGIYYRVLLKCGRTAYEFIGRNKFPYNFDKFVDLLQTNNIIRE